MFAALLHRHGYSVNRSDSGRSIFAFRQRLRRLNLRCPPSRFARERMVPAGIRMFRAISRKAMPEGYAVRISAQTDFGIVRLTKRKDNSKL
jgi:hypothetical protein